MSQLSLIHNVLFLIVIIALMRDYLFITAMSTSAPKTNEDNDLKKYDQTFKGNKSDIKTVDIFGQPLPANRFEMLCNMSKPSHTGPMCTGPGTKTDLYGTCKDICVTLGYTWNGCSYIDPENDGNGFYVCGCSDSFYRNESTETKLWYYVTGINVGPRKNLVTDQKCKTNGFTVIYTKKM